MTTLYEAFQGVVGGGRDIQFLTEVLKQYREVRKVYHYDYTQEDKAALQACATDLRPFTHSFLPGGALYWGLGKLAPSTKQLGGFARVALALLRLGAAGEVFRLGYYVGSYLQGMDCTRRLVSLRSPLGGEMAAIIRARDPTHPLLRHERPPADMNEDGTRPRIVSEANRLAKIEHLQRELAQARAGLEVDRANDRADERLYAILRQREEVLHEIQRGGGPAAAAAAGSVDAGRPTAPRNYREEYEAAGTVGLAGAAGVSAVIGGGGLPPAAHSGGGDQAARSLATDTAQQMAALQAVRAAGGQERGSAGSVGLESSTGGGDPFAALMGGGSGLSGEDSEHADSAAAQLAAAQQRRRQERRKNWWLRHGGRKDEAAAP